MNRRRFLTSAAGAITISGMMTTSLKSAAFGTPHVPPEDDPHVRTFMQWPVSRVVHPDPVFLEMLQDTIARIANSIVEFEPVVMLMAADHTAKARRQLSQAIEIWDIPTEDLWCRDSGPVFVRTGIGEGHIVDLNFNGWGQKQQHRHDGKVAARVAERLGLRFVESGVVGESGGYDHDGEGTLIAHASSWANRNRNQITQGIIERRLRASLGMQRVIWAPGYAGADITDYHIDSLARFLRPGVVLIQLPEYPDRSDPFVRAALRTRDVLDGAIDARGRNLEMVVIPEPERTRINSPDFVSSYVNYYVCNGAVIAAAFGDPRTDEIARQTLANAYGDREIIMLNVDALGEVGGGIHCATQQQPVI